MIQFYDTRSQKDEKICFDIELNVLMDHECEFFIDIDHSYLMRVTSNMLAHIRVADWEKKTLPSVLMHLTLPLCFGHKTIAVDSLLR